MAERDLFLGLDVGTTAIKGGLFDATGGLIVHARRGYPTSRPAPGIVEQNPCDWTEGVVSIMDELLVADRAQRVAAVGLCSQVNTDVFVDAEGSPVAPAITWQDNRAVAEAAELDASVSVSDKDAWWGAPLPIGASHVLARMEWMARERPDVYAKCRYVLTPKDYCLKALAGVVATDPMSSFFVVGRALAYVDPLIRRVDGAAERLAPIKFFTDLVGEIVLGSSGRRAPVVAGTLDAWSGLFGAGVSKAGEGAYISGTSEILAVASVGRLGAPGVVTFPPAAGLNVHAGPTQAGGDALRWWGEVIGRDVVGVVDLAARARRAGPPIVFLPHLEGERAPLWDATLRGLLGYDVRWRKLLAFVVSAALAGLAGGLFASWGNFISPEVFSLPQAALVVIWVLVGGRGTLWGAVVGTVVVQYLTGVLGGAGSTYTTIVLGSILVAIVLLFRRGLTPALTEGVAEIVRRGAGAAVTRS